MRSSQYPLANFRTVTWHKSPSSVTELHTLHFRPRGTTLAYCDWSVPVIMNHGTGFCLEKMDTSQAKTVERPRQREQKQLTKKIYSQTFHLRSKLWSSTADLTYVLISQDKHSVIVAALQN